MNRFCFLFRCFVRLVKKVVRQMVVRSLGLPYLEFHVFLIAGCAYKHERQAATPGGDCQVDAVLVF